MHPPLPHSYSIEITPPRPHQHGLHPSDSPCFRLIGRTHPNFLVRESFCPVITPNLTGSLQSAVGMHEAQGCQMPNMRMPVNSSTAKRARGTNTLQGRRGETHTLGLAHSPPSLPSPRLLTVTSLLTRLWIPQFQIALKCTS